MAVKHWLELVKTDNRPNHFVPYRPAHKVRLFEKKEVNQMAAMDVIEMAQTEWASLILFIPEKTKIPHFCEDYSMVTAVTIWD